MLTAVYTACHMSITCLQGKLKVKPKGRTASSILLVLIKLARQEAIWSNSELPEPDMMDCKGWNDI